MTDFESQLLMELRAIREALEQMVEKSSGMATTNTIGQSASVPPKSKTETPVAVQSVVNPNEQRLQSNGVVQRFYFGTPDGNGFEECNAMDDPDSIRILYVIETQDGVNGRFYPLGRSMSRLKSNAQAFLLPLCSISKSLDDLSAEAIPQNQYGEVQFENGFWKVVRKCVL